MDTLLVVGRLSILDAELAKSLQDSGFSIIETRDPSEALSLCQTLRPALAFVEVDSPECDHFDLLRQLRGTLQGKGRIVAVCNRYSDQLDDYCERLGANFALPQVDSRTDFKLYVRGLISLIPVSRADLTPAACA